MSAIKRIATFVGRSTVIMTLGILILGIFMGPIMASEYFICDAYPNPIIGTGHSNTTRIFSFNSTELNTLGKLDNLIDRKWTQDDVIDTQLIIYLHYNFDQPITYSRSGAILFCMYGKDAEIVTGAVWIVLSYGTCLYGFIRLYTKGCCK